MVKRALVIGLGRSGQGAVKLLSHLQYEAIGVDRNPCNIGIPVFSDDELPPGHFDLAVLSPGITQQHPLVLELKSKKVPVIGEVELALRHLTRISHQISDNSHTPPHLVPQPGEAVLHEHCPHPAVSQFAATEERFIQRSGEKCGLKNVCIGVTGTKGKTTLVHLLAHILKGRPLGNTGHSLAEYAVHPREDEILVIELSSFQLEMLETRALDIAVITNIFPDHLDRYPSFEAYEKTKYRIRDCLKEKGIFLKWDCYLQLTSNERYWGQLDPVAFKLAVAVCQKFGIDEKGVLEALETFQKLPHRLEKVGEIEGRVFINDSQATNPTATLYAIGRMKRPVILIAGGHNKGLSFDIWKEGLQNRVKMIFTIGETAKVLKELLSPLYRVNEAESLEAAAALAFAAAEDGDIILLSPGCASTDQFRDYAHRGEVFRESFFWLRRGI